MQCSTASFVYWTESGLVYNREKKLIIFSNHGQINIDNLIIKQCNILFCRSQNCKFLIIFGNLDHGNEKKMQYYKFYRSLRHFWWGTKYIRVKTKVIKFQ